jgi:hypothetical protein
MDTADYTKPIMFRPTDKDRQVLELLAEKNPILSATAADLLRIALQDYMFNHGPDSGRSKNARLERLEGRFDQVDESLDQMGQRLSRLERADTKQSALLEAICTKLNITM